MKIRTVIEFLTFGVLITMLVITSHYAREYFRITSRPWIFCSAFEQSKREFDQKLRDAEKKAREHTVPFQKPKVKKTRRPTNTPAPVIRPRPDIEESEEDDSSNYAATFCTEPEHVQCKTVLKGM